VHHGGDTVFFGATVTCVDDLGETRTVTIKGIDEVDTQRGEISWISPLARALLKARVGDVVKLATPAGVREVEVLDVHYPPPTA
jgi:transcription elongation factor GreB